MQQKAVPTFEFVHEIPKRESNESYRMSTTLNLCVAADYTVATFKFVDEILKRDHPDVKANGRYFSCGVCYYAVEGDSTFEFVDAIQY